MSSLNFHKTYWILFLISENCIFLLSQNNLARELKPTEIQILKNIPYDSGVPPIFEDSRGFAWIGSFNGLIKYDGYTANFYYSNAEDSTSLIDNKIDCIAEDSNQNLWVGTQNGLCYLNTKTNKFKRYDTKLKSPIVNPRILQIVLNTKKEVIINTNRGIYQYNVEKDEFYLIELMGIDPNQKISILDFTNDRLLISLKNRLWLYNIKDNHTVFSYQQPIGDSGCIIHSYLKINDTLRFCGTACGLYMSPTPSGSSNNIKWEQLLPGEIVSLLAKNKTQIAIGLRDKLIDFDIITRKYDSYATKHNNGQISFFYKMSIGSNNIVWHMHPSIFINDLKLNQIHSIPLDNSLFRLEPQKRNYAFEWSPDKYLLTTIHGVKLYHAASGQFDDFEILNESNTPTQLEDFTDFAEIDSVLVWLGTCSGLYLINKQKMKLIDILSRYPELIRFKKEKICIRKLYLDKKNNNLWIATWAHGLFKLASSGQLIKYTFKGEWENKFRNIYKDRTGNLWFGSRGGIFKYSEKHDTFKIFKNTQDDINTLSENTGFAFYEDLNQNMWIGTYGGGLNKLNLLNDSITRFTTKNGLIDNTIFSIDPDSEDNLWLSTFKGLSHFNRHTGQVRNFTSKNGLINSTLGAFTEGLSVYSNKLLYQGDNGIDIFHPDSIRQSTYSPPIYISKLKLFNKEVEIQNSSESPEGVFRLKEDISFSKSIELNYQQYVITLEYIALDYSSPESIQYAYQLEHFDPDWQYVGTQRSATFTNLKPGKYIFKVKATNADGVWGTKEAKIEISIKPPWWLTWWAYLLYFSTLIGSITGYIRYRSRSLRLRNLVLEEKVQSRTIELNQSLIDLKDTQDKLIQAERDKAEQETLRLKQEAAELEMQALRAQMNPHFIFNALNSINNFIQQNDQLQASEYLIKFSKLIRSVLEYTTLPTISLERELEALRLYIDLESLRFKHKFEYEITFSEDLDTQSILIPPLLLQPFVENAIYHGLMPKSGPGLLFIGIKENAQSLDIVIRDNGIGRSASMQNKPNSNIKHKSMGMSLTIDRIKLFNGNLEYNPIEILDIQDKQGHVQGTEVKINIPIRI